MGWDRPKSLTIGRSYDKPIYTGFFPRWFPSVVDGRRRWGNVARAALVDNLVCSPLLYFPLFYVFKDVVVERSRGLGGALRHSARAARRQHLQLRHVAAHRRRLRRPEGGRRRRRRRGRGRRREDDVELPRRGLSGGLGIPSMSAVGRTQPPRDPARAATRRV